MIKEYNIEEVSCNSCIEKIESALTNIGGVTVKISAPQLSINNNKQPSVDEINALIKTKGDYVIVTGEQKNELIPFPEIRSSTTIPEVKLSTYKPLFIIVGFIAVTTLLSQYPFEKFSLMIWMRYFMAGFFIVFSFFKILNIKGFAASYSMYDVIAAKWDAWGIIYPFVELTLGFLYLTNIFPFETNFATTVILCISSIGVVQSNLSKKKIKCACLGDVFNLPMSTVTIIENLTMVVMAILMILL